MNVLDVSNDYSFLMHNIEGKLSSASKSSAALLATPSTTSKLATMSAARESITATTTGLKRKRLTELAAFDNGDDEQQHYGSQSVMRSSSSASSGRSSSATLKLQAQLDEFKLLNEQLKEQLRSYRDEHELTTEQSIRQLKFLEDSNMRYKKQYETTSAKYYKEKKDWQSKIRELEHALQQQKHSNNTPSSVMMADRGRLSFDDSSVQSKQQLKPNNEDDDVDHHHNKRDIDELSDKYSAKQQEAHVLLSEKMELEKRVFKLEQEAKTSHTLSQGNDDDAVDLRSLRKKCNELETTLRRKNKEYEKFDQKLKNQLLLEEELTALHTKLADAQSAVKRLQLLETSFNKLQDEKKLWNQLFSDVVKNEQGGESSVETRDESEDCTATKVLSVLSNVQKKHLLLTQQHNDLELTLVQLRRQTLKAESRVHDLEGELATMREANEKLEAKLTVMTKQSKCFIGEISSMRSLLKTFDAEFGIGRPDGAKMLATKDKLLGELRDELDGVRQTIVENTAQILSLQSELETVKQAGPLPVESPSDLIAKARFDELKEDFQALQEVTGLDFLPHKTKVNRHNP
jgi:hypothetical protein